MILGRTVRLEEGRGTRLLTGWGGAEEKGEWGSRGTREGKGASLRGHRGWVLEALPIPRRAPAHALTHGHR